MQECGCGVEPQLGIHLFRVVIRGRKLEGTVVYNGDVQGKLNSALHNQLQEQYGLDNYG